MVLLKLIKSLAVVVDNLTMIVSREVRLTLIVVVALKSHIVPEILVK
jgi:hypothetical protein